jgi:hypothetical protein
MFSSLNTNIVHFFFNEFETFEDHHKLFPSDHEQLTLTLSYRSAIAVVPTFRLENIRIAEVRPLYIEIEGYKQRGEMRICHVDVEIHFDPPLKDEENLLGVISLRV